MSGAARGTEGAVDERGNPFWTYDSPTGPLEITINLAKPEKESRGTSPLRRGQPSVVRRLRRSLLEKARLR